MENDIKRYMPYPQKIQAVELTKDNYLKALVLFDDSHKNDYDCNRGLWTKIDESYCTTFYVHGKPIEICEGDYMVFDRNNKWMPRNKEDFNSIYQEITNDMQLPDYKKKFEEMASEMTVLLSKNYDLEKEIERLRTI